MKKKLYFVFLIAALIAVTLIIMVSASVFLSLAANSAYAAEEEAVEETTEEENQPVLIVEKTVVEEADDDFLSVFKNNILPYIVSAGTTGLAVLSMIAPLIKAKGQIKALQGMYTVSKKTLDTYEQKFSEFDAEKIAAGIIPLIKEMLLEELKNALQEADSSADISALQTNVDVLSAQLTSLTEAAKLTWGQVDGVTELLSKAPTAKVLNEYRERFIELKGQVQAQNAELIKPINDVIEELGGAHENE